MPQTIMEYLQNLPPSMQFVLLFITFAGTSGLFTGVFAVWKIYANKEVMELKKRIEPLELERLRTQNEGRQAEAMNENMRKLIEVISVSNDRWQKVIDTKSERQLEADKLQHETNKLFADAMKDNTGAIRNLTEMIEIQSEHYQVFSDKVDGMESGLKTTLQTVEGLARDNRTDLTTALGLSVTSRTENENTLRSIVAAFESLRQDVKQTLSTNENQRNQTLQAIDSKFNLIEQRLTELITPTLPTVTTGNTETNEPDNEDAA